MRSAGEKERSSEITEVASSSRRNFLRGRSDCGYDGCGRRDGLEDGKEDGSSREVVDEVVLSGEASSMEARERF